MRPFWLARKGENASHGAGFYLLVGEGVKGGLLWVTPQFSLTLGFIFIFTEWILDSSSSSNEFCLYHCKDVRPFLDRYS